MGATTDDAAIRDLLTRYCLHLDQREHDAWVDLFTEDGQFFVYGTSFDGPSGLKEMATTAPDGLHMVGPALLQIDGDRATSKQSFLFMDAVTHTSRIGWYDDELVRRPDGWRIRARRCTFLAPDGPSHRPGRPTPEDDVAAISALLAKYALHVDQRDPDAFAALFTPDARLEIEGRDPLTTDEQRRALASGERTGVHLPGTPAIEVRGRTATAQQSFLFWNATTGTPRGGWYDDELVLTRDGWRFQRRTCRFLFA